MHSDHGKGCPESHGGHGHSMNNGTRLVLVIIFNSVITVSEYIGGVLSGSLSLMSDAGHNLSDVLSLILGYAGEKITGRDPSKKFTFGLKRFEVLIALVNALFLIGIGIFIAYEAVQRLSKPVDIDIGIMIPVAVIGFFGNLFSIFILSRNRESNLNMKAAFLHLLYDAVSSLGVIIAGVIIRFTGLVWVDLVFSLVIVVMIFWSSKDIIMESLRIFLQGAPLHIDSDEIYRKIREVKSVKDIHGLHIWSINSTETFLSCHITLSEGGSGVDTNDIIRHVNEMLSREFGIEHTTLQVETMQICHGGKNDCCR